MDESKKREELRFGEGRQLIRPCTGDVRQRGRTFRSTLGTKGGASNQACGSECGRCFDPAIAPDVPSQISLATNTLTIVPSKTKLRLRQG